MLVHVADAKSPPDVGVAKASQVYERGQLWFGFMGNEARRLGYSTNVTCKVCLRAPVEVKPVA